MQFARWIPLVALGLAVPAFAQEAEMPAPEAPAVDEVPAEPAASGPRTYALDPAKSWIYVMVFNDPDRWTPVTGHDHGIKATTFEGSVVWDEADPGACKVEISFPVTALAIDPPGMRARAGLPEDGAIGDGAKSTATGNMLGKNQLESSTFATVQYTSSKCSGTTGKVAVTGTLSVHGVGKELTVPMQVAITGDVFTAKGSFELTHADFGMKPFTYGPATPKNQDKLAFTVDVVGTAQ